MLAQPPHEAVSALERVEALSAAAWSVLSTSATIGASHSYHCKPLVR